MPWSSMPSEPDRIRLQEMLDAARKAVRDAREVEAGYDIAADLVPPAGSRLQALLHFRLRLQ